MPSCCIIRSGSESPVSNVWRTRDRDLGFEARNVRLKAKKGSFEISSYRVKSPAA